MFRTARRIGWTDPTTASIGIANGGTEASVNQDDGELNQKHGLVSQAVRGTGELILAFGKFGVYARAAAFDDWAMDGSLDRTPHRCGTRSGRIRREPA